MTRKKSINFSSHARKIAKRARDRFGRFLPKIRRDEKGRFVKRRELPPPKWYTPDWKSPKEREKEAKKKRAIKERAKSRIEKTRKTAHIKAEYKDGVEYRVLFSCPAEKAYLLEEFLGGFIPDKKCIYKVCLDSPTHYGIFIGNASMFKLRTAADVQRLLIALEKIDLQKMLENSDGVKKKKSKTKRGKKRSTPRKSVNLLFVEIERA